MKRKLGRFFARVSGVLRRVFRWFLPTAVRTDVQLAPPRPDTPAPTVTREVVDLEYEEIRAALAVEPSVNAAAPEAPRRPEHRPLETLRFGTPQVPPQPLVPKVEPVAPAVTAAGPVEAAVTEPSVEPPQPGPSVPEQPAYKAPKYGRDPKAKAKLAAPRPTPAAPVAGPKVDEAKPLAASDGSLEDTAVADLLARVDAFLNMGELPTASPESVIAAEPRAFVEEPTVRHKLVDQLAAEQVAVEPADTVVTQQPSGEATAPDAALAANVPLAIATSEVIPLEVGAARASAESSGIEAEAPHVIAEPSWLDAAAPNAVEEEPSSVESAGFAEGASDAVATEPVAPEALAAEGAAPETIPPRPDPFEFIASLRDGQPPPELVSEPVALAEVLPELVCAADSAGAHEPDEGVTDGSDDAVRELPEARAVAGFGLPLLDDAFVEDVAFADAEESIAAPVPSAPSIGAVMVTDEALSALDQAPLVEEATLPTDAADEAVLVAEAAESVASAEPAHVYGVEAVAGETVTAPADVVVEPARLADVLAAVTDEPTAELSGNDEPTSPVDPASAPLSETSMADGDAEIDAELDAAMAQAEDANTAFAASHPEAVDEPAPPRSDDDDERVEDEPWSPPPVMADPYYELAPPTDDADAEPLPNPAGEPSAEVSLADDGVADVPQTAAAPADATSGEGEPVPPEAVAVTTDDDATGVSLADEATIHVVAAAVEETLAAADTLDAANRVLEGMPADADATAAAAMHDVVATASAAEEKPAAAVPTFRNPIPRVETPTDYIATPESMHALYQLQLDGFEGPLDLLLHLIKRHHLDIFDIPIAFICERYLAYLKAMEDVDIDVASEFLFMAAELLQLKSRMLLPRPEGETPEEEEVDPRAELVRRLLEYQKYKDVAERFGLLDRFGRDTFGREAEPTPPPEGEAPLKEVGLFALVKAFQACLDRQKPEVRHQVLLEQVSVRQRIRVLVQRFESQEPTRFDLLLEDAKRRIDIVVTFLALLEMGKLKLLRIFQSEDGVIYVHPKFDDVSLAFARLEGLDESQYAG